MNFVNEIIKSMENYYIHSLGQKKIDKLVRTYALFYEEFTPHSHFLLDDHMPLMKNEPNTLALRTLIIVEY